MVSPWMANTWKQHDWSMEGLAGSGQKSRKKVLQYPQARAVAVNSTFPGSSPAQRPGGRYQSLRNNPSFVPPPLFYSRYSME